MGKDTRTCDIVLLGPTGFTGLFIAEYIVHHLPTNLSWALAGRSLSKLQNLAHDLQKLKPDRPPPSIKVLELLPEQLQDLTRETKVVINAIGPYSLYGSVVVEACAMTGTHYLDLSTETAWIRDVIQKYDNVAKAHKASIIPAIGNSSSPSDLVVFLLTKHSLESYGSPPGHIQSSMRLTLKGMSSGSLASVTTVSSQYGVWNLLFPSPDMLIPSQSSRRLFQLGRLSGYSYSTGLGHLTTSFAAGGNKAIVYRSKFLRPSIYHEHLCYQEFMPVASHFQGLVIHLITIMGILLLALPPFRLLLKILKPTKSGSGPEREILQDEMIEVDAISRDPDGKGSKIDKAKYAFRGPMYGHAALLAAEAAMVLLSSGVDTGVGEEKYGVLTPSCLGMAFVDRLRKVNVILEVDKAHNMVCN